LLSAIGWGRYRRPGAWPREYESRASTTRESFLMVDAIVRSRRAADSMNIGTTEGHFRFRTGELRAA
jgi:hypothetical protein